MFLRNVWSSRNILIFTSCLLGCLPKSFPNFPFSIVLTTLIHSKLHSSCICLEQSFYLCARMSVICLLNILTAGKSFRHSGNNGHERWANGSKINSNFWKKGAETCTVGFVLQGVLGTWVNSKLASPGILKYVSYWY